MAKLKDLVIDILELKEKGFTLEQISNILGVNVSLVERAVSIYQL
jgi:transcriptional regulator